MKTIKSVVWYLELKRESWRNRQSGEHSKQQEYNQQYGNSKPQEYSRWEEGSKQLDYQERKDSPETKSADSGLPEGFSVKPFHKPDNTTYLELYKSVGSSYNWCDRLLMPKEELQKILQSDTTEICLLKYKDESAGFVEFDKSTPGETEIVYFGLMEQFTGKKAGFPFLRWAINHAMEHSPEHSYTPETNHVSGSSHAPETNHVSRSSHAPEQGINRLWLHTCDLDHPAALPLYQKAGFVIYKTETVDQPVLEL